MFKEKKDEAERPEQLLYNIPDIAWILGDVSHNHVKNLMARGKIKEVRVGRRKMGTADSVKRLVEEGGSR